MSTSLSQSIRNSTRAMSLLVVALIVALTPAVASAHAVVYPRKSSVGAYERYVLRVPNEKTVATTRIEIRFPDDVRIIGFQDVTGWTLQVLTDSTQRIVGAVWTGNLPPQRFVEFGFIAANPKAPGNLVWPVYQTYEGLPRVDWTGAKGTRTPASVTMIADSTAAAGDGAPAASGPASSFQWVQWLALAIAVIALGIAIRPRDRAA